MTWGVILCLSYELRNSAIDEFSSNICDLIFHAIHSKDKFSIIDENGVLLNTARNYKVLLNLQNA